MVLQLKVALVEYACHAVHALEPGARSQNSYRGLGQPDALAVRVTEVPDDDGEGGAADAITDAQGPGGNGVTGLEGTEAGPVPTAFVAVTVNV
jgi:hypothetical protein